MAVQISGNDITVPRDTTVTRNLTVGGVLTYEDVTNVDSVGLITARSGIEIGASPGVAASISVDGNAIFSGITTIGGALSGTTATFTGDVDIADKIIHTGDTDTAIRFPAADTITAETGGTERLRIKSDASSVSIGSSVFLGIETSLITNGDFSNGTANWTASSSSIAVSSGVLTLTPNSGVNGFAYQEVTNLVVGKHYNVQVTVTEDADNRARLYVGTSANGNQNVTNLYLGVGTHSFSFKATATTHYVSLVVGGGTGQATKFDNVRLIESNSISFSTPTGNAPSLRPHAFEGMSINTGGVDTLIVSKEGYVTKPNTPSFLVFPSNNAETANGDVTYTNVSHNIGNHYSTSTGRFTAPVAGYYSFFANYVGEAACTSCQVMFKQNGSLSNTGNHYSGNGSSFMSCDLSGTHTYLAAHDYIQLNLTAGGASQGQSSYMRFFGYLTH